MKIVDELMNRGDLVAIVVNDVGDISVDAKFVEAHGLKVKEISGGCICCQIAGSFAETIAKLYDAYHPDIVIVEPSGVAIPWGLKRAAEYSEVKTDVTITHAPVITLAGDNETPLQSGTLTAAVDDGSELFYSTNNETIILYRGMGN